MTTEIDLDHFRKQVGKRTLVTPNTQAIDALIGENDQLRAENQRLREALSGMVEVGLAYQSIKWNEDCEGDNYDEAIANAEEALKGS